MNARVKQKIAVAKTEKLDETKNPALFEASIPVKPSIEDDSEEEFYDMERSESDPTPQLPSTVNASTEPSIPWKEELECLVQGGVPMALRGEVSKAAFPISSLLFLYSSLLKLDFLTIHHLLQLWQAFVGVKARRIEKYYQNLLDSDTKNDNILENQISQTENGSNGSKTSSVESVICIPEKWKGQIEKVIV